MGALFFNGYPRVRGCRGLCTAFPLTVTLANAGAYWTKPGFTRPTTARKDTAPCT